MKREPDRENYSKDRELIWPVKDFCDGVRVSRQEVEVLEDREHSDVSEDAHYQPRFSPASFGVFDQNSGGVVYRDRQEQDQDVDRNERHVEVAAREEQPRPSEPVRQDEIDRHHHREKDQEGEGVE